jgi:hypothetical protein
MKTLSSARTFASAAFGAISLCAVGGGAAYAGSVTQPGETVGISLGAPLPPDVYLATTGSIGERGDVEEGVNIPVVLWSTPWTILGGRIEPLIALPELYVGNHKAGAFNSGWFNPFIGGMIAWDLGNGLGVSYLAGAYIGFTSNGFGSAFDQNTFRQDIHLSYSNDGWTANANLIFGIVGDNKATHAANPNYFNYDLSLTKTFDKWSFGPVAFGSTDVSSPSGHASQSQFALGGLVGYNFGPVILQTYLTSDVTEKNYGSHDTRLWLRLIVPL